MESQVRVLHIRKMLYTDGVTAFEMDKIRNMDRQKVISDFIVYQDSAHCKQVEDHGGRYYVLQQGPQGRMKKILHRYYSIYKIVKQNHYRIIHVDTDIASRVIDMFCCKLGGAKTIILHSHCSTLTAVGKKLERDTRVHKFFKPMIPWVATDYFSCSKDATEWMFPKKIQNQVKFIKNGVNIEKFAYRPEIRRQVREELGLENSKVIGHVGRFAVVKNHSFLLQVFQKFLKHHDDSKLLLVGDGPERKAIEERAVQLGIQDKVVFTGIRKDANRLMQGMDVFVMPSLFEGLPVTLIEAQCCGLPIVISDTITPECMITPETRAVSLQESAEFWSEKIEEVLKMPRKDGADQVSAAGFDIAQVGKALERFYLERQ